MYQNLILCVVFVSQLLSVLSSMMVNDRSYLIVQWSQVGPFPNDTRELVDSDNSNVTGRIVWLDGPSYNTLAYIKPFKMKIDILAQKGCVGVITCYKLLNIPGFLIIGSVGANFALPVGMVPYDVYPYFNSVGERTNITFINWDPNPWEIVEEGPFYMAITGIIFGLFFFNFVFSACLIGKWIYVLKKIDLNIGFISLLLECVCSIIRMIEMVLSPLRGNFQLPSLDILFTFPACLTVITSILIIFFWLDLTSDPFYHGKFLGTMRKPAFVFIFVLSLYEISMDMARSLTDQIDMAYTTISFYLGMNIILTFFNFVAGYRILRTIKIKGKERLKLIIRRIIYSGFATVFGLVIMTIGLTPANTYPFGVALLWFLLQISFWLQSVLLITIFQVPTKKKERSSTTKQLQTESASASASTL